MFTVAAVVVPFLSLAPVPFTGPVPLQMETIRAQKQQDCLFMQQAQYSNYTFSKASTAWYYKCIQTSERLSQQPFRTGLTLQTEDVLFKLFLTHLGTPAVTDETLMSFYKGKYWSVGFDRAHDTKVTMATTLEKQ